MPPGLREIIMAVSRVDNHNVYTPRQGDFHARGSLFFQGQRVDKYGVAGPGVGVAGFFPGTFDRFGAKVRGRLDTTSADPYWNHLDLLVSAALFDTDDLRLELDLGTDIDSITGENSRTHVLNTHDTLINYLGATLVVDLGKGIVLEGAVGLGPVEHSCPCDGSKDFLGVVGLLGVGVRFGSPPQPESTPPIVPLLIPPVSCAELQRPLPWGGVQFYQAQSDLTVAGWFAVLNLAEHIARLWQDEPLFRQFVKEIVIHGHTNSDLYAGVPYDNQRLSQDRADVVLHALQLIFQQRRLAIRISMRAVGHGDANLIYRDGGEEDKQASRRTEVQYIFDEQCNAVDSTVDEGPVSLRTADAQHLQKILSGLPSKK